MGILSLPPPNNICTGSVQEKAVTSRAFSKRQWPKGTLLLCSLLTGQVWQLRLMGFSQFTCLSNQDSPPTYFWPLCKRPDNTFITPTARVTISLPLSVQDGVRSPAHPPPPADLPSSAPPQAVVGHNCGAAPRWRRQRRREATGSNGRRRAPLRAPLPPPHSVIPFIKGSPKPDLRPWGTGWIILFPPPSFPSSDTRAVRSGRPRTPLPVPWVAVVQIHVSPALNFKA